MVIHSEVACSVLRAQTRYAGLLMLIFSRTVAAQNPRRETTGGFVCYYVYRIFPLDVLMDRLSLILPENSKSLISKDTGFLARDQTSVLAHANTSNRPISPL